MLPYFHLAMWNGHLSNCVFRVPVSAVTYSSKKLMTFSNCSQRLQTCDFSYFFACQSWIKKYEGLCLVSQSGCTDRVGGLDVYRRNWKVDWEIEQMSYGWTNEWKSKRQIGFTTTYTACRSKDLTFLYITCTYFPLVNRNNEMRDFSFYVFGLLFSHTVEL